MPTVLIARDADADDATAPISRVGGKPLFGPTETWPTCGGCHEPLSFLAQIDLGALDDTSLPDAWAELFTCGRYGPDCGAPGREDSAVLIVKKDDARPAEEPPSSADAKERRIPFPPDTIVIEAKKMDQVPPIGSDAPDGRMIIGHAGGEYEWAQDPVELDCECGTTMKTVFQLDEAWGMTMATYTLACPACHAARLVVQSY